MGLQLQDRHKITMTNWLNIRDDRNGRGVIKCHSSERMSNFVHLSVHYSLESNVLNECSDIVYVTDMLRPIETFAILSYYDRIRIQDGGQ